MMAKARKSKQQAESSGSTQNTVVFTVRVEPEVAAALDALIASQPFPPTRSVVVVRGLVELLERQGFWPPKNKG